MYKENIPVQLGGCQYGVGLATSLKKQQWHRKDIPMQTSGSAPESSIGILETRSIQC